MYNSKLAYFIFALLIMSKAVAAQTTQSPFEEMAKLNWWPGPYKAEISEFATIQLGEGYVYLGSDHTNKALELMGNLPSTAERYMVGKDRLQWFAVFNYVDSGYIRDDEKIDADALLKDMMASNKKSNKKRREKGLRTLELVGWSVPPHYNTDTKRLEWGTRLRNEDGHFTVNYTSRLLGRSGYIAATLVTNAKMLTKDVAEYKNLLTKFSYIPGEDYTEFRKGDKVAEYGLAALVAGGAAAAVVKSKGLWKIIGAAIIDGCNLGFFQKPIQKALSIEPPISDT